MKFSLAIEMDNAAFASPNGAIELSRILHEVARHFDLDGDDSGIMTDCNGNRVGTFEITHEQQALI